MPFYDFVCPNCGHQFSKMLPIGTTEAECSMCQAKAKKRISAPAVHFSGSGFYASDNRKQSTTKTEPKADPAKKETKNEPAIQKKTED